MKTKTIMTGMALGAMALMLAVSQAQANLISGSSIAFAGTFTLPAGDNIGNTTALDNVNSVVVGDTDSYAAIPFGTAATFANPLTTTTPATPLWTVDSGGNVYTFFATSLAVTLQFYNPSHGGYGELDMDGLGYAEINGSDPTAGSWSVTATQGGHGTHAAFGFDSSASVIGVPDGCTTLGLLGSALVLLQGLRRKFDC